MFGCNGMISVMHMVLALATARDLDKASPLDSPYVRLYNHLFHDYQKAVRPTLDASRGTNVIVSPNLYSIINVEEGDETLSFSRWFQMFWNDPFLVWDPTEFNGTEEMLVNVGKIWVPDITIIEILNDIINVYCSFDVQNFPYDGQNCSVSYVSWEYPANEITVNAMDSDHKNLMFYGPSAEWDLLSYSWNNLSITDNTSISFDGVRYFIGIKRKPMFYIISLVLPSFLITTLSIVGIFSPSETCNERKERITIGLTASLAMSVVLMMVSNLMPKSDKKFPLLGKYMLWQMVITGAATVVAVGCMYIQAAAVSLDKDLPEWMLNLMWLSNKERIKKNKRAASRSRVYESNGTTDLAHAENGTHPRPLDSVELNRFDATKQDVAHRKTNSPPMQRNWTYNTNNQYRTWTPRVENELTIVFKRIERIIGVVGDELSDRQVCKRRSMLAIRFCYRLDIVLNIVFNLFNVILAFASFDFELFGLGPEVVTANKSTRS